MARVLIVSPNRWGRGITNIWIASHTGILRSQGHQVELFDATFFRNWTLDEIGFNTDNKMYKPADYHRHVDFSEQDVRVALQEKIDDFEPDLIFSGGISSHIHGEGEYVLPQYFVELLDGLTYSARLVVGGLQPLALKESFFDHYPIVDGIVIGESEKTICAICEELDLSRPFDQITSPGFLSKSKVQHTSGILMSSLDEIGRYDYSIFSQQAFLRAFQGKIVKAIDFEISRGCIYTCSYCVETVIQQNYGFFEHNDRGALKSWPKYLRSKSAKNAFAEFERLYTELGITFFRMQDTNFLTIDKNVLAELANLFEASGLNRKIQLYVETRPEGINERSIDLLKKLGVVGVGMGVELSSQTFRESNLNRFANTEKVERAFSLLRVNGILRTAYNIIGLPDTTEDDIIETIKFNARIDPDNITVAYFSPYAGTNQANRAVDLQMADPYEKDVDSALRGICHGDITVEQLQYYKKNFVGMVLDCKK